MFLAARVLGQGEAYSTNWGGPGLGRRWRLAKGPYTRPKEALSLF